MIALTAAILFTPLERIEQPLLLLEDGLIAEVSSRTNRAVPANCRVVDFGNAILAPGFIDLHIHGGAGHDVMEAAPEVLPSLEKLLAHHGVCSYFPTTVTAPLDTTLSALERLADAIECKSANGDGHRARPLGIHIEGPFISHARRGVHPAENLLAPTLARFDRLWQAARGHISLMTIAPELDGALEVITEATKRGVCVSLGHSDAHIDVARSALAAGARHATHTFNAMRPLSHRDPGILGLILADSRFTADIIVDGIHVDPSVVEIFLRLKGTDRAVLITDALSATGMPDGHYRLGPFEFEVKEERCVAGGRLAGSVLTMDRALRNLMQFVHLDFEQALRTATLNPARVTGVSARRGVLAAGAEADIAVLNPQYEVIKTLVHGVGV
jgi:N-acetylglucosamine-6-phosphate deacetylase